MNENPGQENNETIDFDEDFIVDNSEFWASIEENQTPCLMIPDSLMSLCRAGKILGEKFRVIIILLSDDLSRDEKLSAMSKGNDEMTLRRFLKELVEDGFLQSQAPLNLPLARRSFIVNTPDRWDLREQAYPMNSVPIE